MKRFKKLVSVLLAVVMVLAMSVPSFADGAGKITITNPTAKETYTIYKILDVESYNAAANAYAYKAAKAWNAFINSTPVKGIYVEVDGQGYVTWKEGADAAAFAKLALKYAEDNKIENEGEKSLATGETTIVFDGLNLGYYLVGTTLGTLCMLDTTNPEVEITEKNEAALNTKTVEEDSIGFYGGANDADMGQIVNFKSTITAKEGAESYVLHDMMNEGLDYNEDVAVTLNGTNVDAFNYTVKTDLTDECTFEVAFTQDFCDTLEDNDTIVVSYSATLTNDAIVGSDGNINKSWLTYGSNQSTTESVTITKTWSVNIYKYTTTDDEDDADGKVELAGATFAVSTASDATKDTTNKHIKFVATGEDNVYLACTNDNCDHVKHMTEITTDATGEFTLKGLDSDSYQLIEIKAPDGYNKLAQNVTFRIADTGEIKMQKNAATGQNEEVTVNKVEVLNQSGTELPSTGGIGTTVFYAAGIVLMAGAVFFVVRRKRG